jgi:large subunit ribosomal protein L35
MPKLKTKKTAKKRFKETGSGKIMRRHARTSHLKSKQSAAKKRRKSGRTRVSKENRGKVKKMIGGK